MILIFISWIYIVFATINLGFQFDKIFKLECTNFIFISFLGLLATTIIASFWAIFGRINIEFHLFLIVLNGLILFKSKSEIASIYKDIITQIDDLSTELKGLLLLISFLIIAQTAATPFIIDNETYYVQTIKWLNEYGFVKGLANLHIFFGQTSGWHIAQSVFNFSFLYENFNDLSGFCLLLGNLFAILQLNLYFKNNNKIFLIIGFLPVFNALLFQFISAPSPDITIYIISFLLFSLLIENYNNTKPETLNLMFILCFFLVFIKSTSIIILLIPILLLFKTHKNSIKKLLPSVFVGLMFFVLFVVKNTILTGYPLYPTQLIEGMTFDFTIPKELMTFFFNKPKLYSFFLTNAEFHSMTNFQIMIKWLTYSVISVFFNILSLLLIVLIPFYIYKFNNKKEFLLLYTIMVLQLFVLLITSPQFRFFLNFILFFSCFVLACLFQSKKLIMSIIFLSTIIVLVLVLLPLKMNGFTKNKLFNNTSNFRIENIILPNKNSNISLYNKQKNGNLNYYSPDKNSYFWYSGNGNLPCVNSQQLDYFETYFKIIPQQRTNDLKDGFYSKKTIQQ